MSDDPEMVRFAAARSVEEVRQAAQPLLATSAAARAAKDANFAAVFDGWSARLPGEPAPDLLATLWRMTGLGSMSRHRRRLVAALGRGIGEFARPIASMPDPKDRRAAAEALEHVDGAWVVDYCAEAVARDPDPKSDARDALCRVLLVRTGEVGAAFRSLADPMSSVVIAQSDVATGRARRVAWILRSMRPALYEVEAAVADAETGDAYASFVFAGLRSAPGERGASMDAAREVLLCMNVIVRLHGVSLATKAATYSALSQLRRRLGWHDWPDDLSDEVRLLGLRIEDALLALGRQGVADGELRKAYVELLGSVTASRRLARLVRRSAGLDEEVAYWLENGSGRIRLETSGAIEEASMSGVDADISTALVGVDALERAGGIIDDERVRRLSRAVREAARKRGLVLRGSVGDVVEYSPGEHELDGGAIGARSVVLLRPVVDRVVGGRRVGVSLKAEVSPA